MKRILLLVSLFSLVVVAFLGCHKDPIEFGNVGVLNLSLQRGYKTNNKAALESFDARVTIYYSTEDTISYNCRFTDIDGDGRYINDPKELDCIYVRREVGFWVGVWTVIQGDTVMGMSDPTNLLYLSEENPVLDVTIVLEAGYPRIIVSSTTGFDGENVLLYGNVIEGAEMLEQYAFAVKRGPLSDEEKLFWSKRVLSDVEYQELFYNGDYELVEAELDYNEPNRFVGLMEMYDLDSAEYSVVALAALRMNDGDSIPSVIHSPVVTMTISGGGAIIDEYVYIDEPYYNGDTVTLYGNYAGNNELYECGFVLGFSDYELTDTMSCRVDGASFSLPLFGFQPNTTYYYRAYVKTADGIIESEVGQFQIMGSIQEFAVYTESATEITESSATLNGYVTYTDGVEYCGFILNMGTYNDTIRVESFAGGNFSYQVSNLAPSTTYSYQAFANRGGWEFGEEMSFTTSRATAGTLNGHTWVDLGLPSGLLWATTNIGAENPEDYGNYYAWGETEPKETYDWSTYRYCNGSETTLTKYCNDESYGNEGYTDNLTTLEAEDDAATANWGAGWRMPTQGEMQELIDNCTITWATQNGVNGALFTGPNGNSIFLPAAGDRYDSELNDAGSYGYYWSSSLRTGSPNNAWLLYLGSGNYYMGIDYRYYGQSVRPVCVSSQN